MNNQDLDHNVFIGSRELSKEQVKLIVPTYELILSQIQEIREQALREYEQIKTSKENPTRNGEIKKQHNNTIGLFGARGTGKTSCLYTIIGQLKREGKENIVLPIIEPDNFGENTKILGCILGLLKKVVDNIEKNLKNDLSKKDTFPEFYNECRFKPENELHRKYNELLEYYCYTEDEYRKLLTQDYKDMETYKKKYSYILSPDLEFSRRLEDFINELVKVKRKCSEKEPLIFMFIDDIDLKTSKCKELIESVMQYTCHPNVVCILSGDYEILKESITLTLLENEKISQSFLCEKEELFDNEWTLVKRKKYLTDEYLKKILPPAFRHNVIKWNLFSIPIFTFEDMCDSENNVYRVYLYEKLNEIFGEDNIFCHRVRNDSLTEVKNDIILIKSSYNIFDNTPRGLVNVYYYLNKFNKENLERDEQNWFIYVKSLIDTFISSSSILIKYQNEYFNNFVIWGSDESTSIVDLDKLYKCISYINKYDDKEENDKTNGKDKIKKYLCFFILCYCIKKLLPKIIFKNNSEAKENFMFLIYKTTWFSSVEAKRDFISLKGVHKDKNYIWQYDKRLYNEAISELLLHTTLEFGLAFHECTINNMSGNDIFIDNKNTEIQFYNEQAFLNIYKLLFTSEDNALNIIKSWYRAGYESKGNMKRTIEFLDKISRKIAGYEIITEIFEPLNIDLDRPLQCVVSYDDVELSLMQGPEKNELRTDHNDKKHKVINDIYNIYIKDLIIRRLNDITSTRIGTEDVSQRYDKLYSILCKINSDNYKDNKNIKEKADLYIEDKIKNVGNDIQNEIMEIEVNDAAISIININSKINQFYDNKNDGVSQTIYLRTSRYITKIMDDLLKNKTEYISLASYIKIINKLDYLAYGTNAWYGVENARNLLQYIKNNAQLEFSDNFEDYVQYVLYEYSEYRKKNNPNIIKKRDFERKKEKMKEILERAFEDVRDEEKFNLSGIGLELEDMEHDI